jgi:hypothetical protein
MWGADRGDCGHLAADQIAYQRGQAIIGARQPVVLDRYVLAFDVTSFAETLRNAATFRASVSADPVRRNATTGSAGC